MYRVCCEVLYVYSFAGADYEFTNIIYSLSGDERKGCQEIRIKNDTLSEPAEQFSVSLISFPIDRLVDLEPDTIIFIVEDNNSK